MVRKGANKMTPKWIVVRDWGMETAVDEFEDYLGAVEFFNEWKDIGSQFQLYIAQVQNKHENK